MCRHTLYADSGVPNIWESNGNAIALHPCSMGCSHRDAIALPFCDGSRSDDSIMAETRRPGFEPVSRGDDCTDRDPSKQAPGMACSVVSTNAAVRASAPSSPAQSSPPLPVTPTSSTPPRTAAPPTWAPEPWVAPTATPRAFPPALGPAAAGTAVPAPPSAVSLYSYLYSSVSRSAHPYGETSPTPCCGQSSTSPVDTVHARERGATREDILAHRAPLERSMAQSAQAGLAYVLRHGVQIPAVDIDGPAVLRRRTAALFDTSAVPSLLGRVYPVTGNGRRYHRRGERPFVTHCELAPSPLKKYVRANRVGFRVIVKSIRRCDVPHNVLSAYHHIIASFPRLLLGPGVFGVGLFAEKDVEDGRYFMEYTGNRIWGKKSQTMHRALDRLDCSPDVMVKVEDETVTIDTRRCGNDTKSINHPCNPNAQLLEATVGSKTILLIQATTAIAAGEEIVMDYGYNSLHTSLVLLCVCGAPNCRPEI